MVKLIIEVSLKDYVPDYSYPTASLSLDDQFIYYIIEGVCALYILSVELVTKLLVTVGETFVSHLDRGIV